jgi:hypothetical protein
MGDWASNLTDTLLDNRYDILDYDNDEDVIAIIFRYYTRLLLLVSEMVDDFTHLFEHLNHSNQTKKALRKTLDTNTIDTDKLMRYINQVCKHKYENVHACNHHLPVFFDDSNLSHAFKNPISIEVYPSHPDGIIMPKLKDVLGVIIKGYRTLDSRFLEEDGKPTKLLVEFTENVGVDGDF